MASGVPACMLSALDWIRTEKSNKLQRMTASSFHSPQLPYFLLVTRAQRKVGIHLQVIQEWTKTGLGSVPMIGSSWCKYWHLQKLTYLSKPVWFCGSTKGRPETPDKICVKNGISGLAWALMIQLPLRGIQCPVHPCWHKFSQASADQKVTHHSAIRLVKPPPMTANFGRDHLECLPMSTDFLDQNCSDHPVLSSISLQARELAQWKETSLKKAMLLEASPPTLHR